QRRQRQHREHVAVGRQRAPEAQAAAHFALQAELRQLRQQRSDGGQRQRLPGGGHVGGRRLARGDGAVELGVGGGRAEQRRRGAQAHWLAGRPVRYREIEPVDGQRERRLRLAV